MLAGSGVLFPHCSYYLCRYRLSSIFDILEARLFRVDNSRFPCNIRSTSTPLPARRVIFLPSGSSQTACVLVFRLSRIYSGRPL